MRLRKYVNRRLRRYRLLTSRGLCRTSEPRAVATGQTLSFDLNHAFGLNWPYDPVVTARGSDTHCLTLSCRRDISCRANRFELLLVSETQLLTAHRQLLTMKDWIALNMTPGVGPRVTTRLLEHFGSAEAIFDAPRRELALLRLTPETIESIANRELHDRDVSEIESVRILGGDVLVLYDG